MSNDIINLATMVVTPTCALPCPSGDQGTQAEIQEYTGCRIKSGMTSFDIFICLSNNKR